MENRFAGAQDAGDRRRRRLSNSDDDDQLLEEFISPDRTNDDSGQIFADSFPNSAQLLRRLISPRLWKHVCVLVLLLAGVSTLVWWNRSLAESASDGLHDSRVVNAVTGLLLLVAGQLAFLTGWIRSHSTLDFRGRYRWWKWLGLGAICSGTTMITGLDVLIPNLVVSIVETMTGPVQAARPALVLVPGVLASVIVFGSIIPDMGRSIWSQGFLVAAVLVMTIRVMLIHTSSRSIVDESTLCYMQLISACFGFAAMLLHCRFVAFVNNDPPVVVQRLGENSMSSSADSQPVVAETPDVIVADNSASEDKAAQPVKKRSTGKKKAPGRKRRKAA